MLDINVENLITNIEELSSLIDTYEENTMTIAYELKNNEPNWHDDNSWKFFESMGTLKLQLVEFIANLRTVNSTYQYVVDQVHNINRNIKKIFCNQSKENSIIQAYDNAISSLRDTQYRINHLSIGFCSYYEQKMIRNEINRITNQLNSLERSKTTIIKMFNDLSNLEGKIITAFSKLSIDNISQIDYTQYLN